MGSGVFVGEHSAGVPHRPGPSVECSHWQGVFTLVTEAHAQRRQNPSQEMVDEISLVAQTSFGSARNFQNRRVHLALRSPLLPTPAPATRPVPSPHPSRCPQHCGPACSEQALGSALFPQEGHTPFLPASVSRCFLPELRRRTMGMPLTLFQALTAASTLDLGGVRAPPKSRWSTEGVMPAPPPASPSASLPHK